MTQVFFRLTNTENEQVQLNSIRQMFTYLSSIIVFLLAGVIIKSKDGASNELTWEDCWDMQTLWNDDEHNNQWALKTA